MVLLVASRRERVNRYLAIFQQAGLQCEHLEVTPCAAARVLRYQEGFYAIVDLDQAQTVISVAEGPQLLFSRTLKTGYGEWIQRVAEGLELSQQAAHDLLQAQGLESATGGAMDVDAAAESGTLGADIIPSVVQELCARALDQLIKEIRRTTDYFALLPGGGRVGRIHLLGEVLPRGLEHILEARLQVQALRGALPEPERKGQWGLEKSPRWLVATGLALRGAA
jgi:Tfp pilus assembly PilM family ATPase